ncbi:MAG: P-II family nitrogen regulator [Clostridia bacterium]|nr:P-II family nitrogen regulator [Clostridia bacterium]
MIKHDLILAVVNRGFSDEAMTAARNAGAYGGTVLHARGTSTNEMQKFFGTVIQPEKELVLILTEKERRNDIMTAICRDTGLASEGMGICFSVPVDGVMGIRRFEVKPLEEADKPSDTPEDKK